MAIRLEHANITVRKLEESVRFVSAAFPEFRIRREGEHDGRRWLHIGTDDTYIAFNEASREPAEKWVPYDRKPGVNHLGYEVDDVDALRIRLTEAGFEDSTYPNDHPYRKRVYFYDADGNDWEFVEYLSDDPGKRNDYELPD